MKLLLEASLPEIQALFLKCLQLKRFASGSNNTIKYAEVRAKKACYFFSSRNIEFILKKEKPESFHSLIIEISFAMIQLTAHSSA